MAVTKRRWFVHAHLAWTLGAAFVLTLLDSLTYELFFATSLIGFLIIVELTGPFRVTPVWSRRIRWVVLFGLLWFVYIMFRRTLEVLPSGVFQ